MRPVTVEGGQYLSRWFTKWYTVKHFAIAMWLYFLKANHLNYYDIKICSTWLTSLPENSSILDQLPHINDLETDNSAPMQRPPVIDFQPVELGSNVLDGEFNDDILDTLVPDLVPDLNELEL